MITSLEFGQDQVVAKNGLFLRAIVTDAPLSVWLLSGLYCPRLSPSLRLVLLAMLSDQCLQLGLKKW